MRIRPRLCLVIPALLFAASAVAEPVSRRIHVDAIDYRVVDLDLAQDRLELHWQDGDGHPFAGIDRLKSWGEAQHRELLFAANAGIYDREFRPLGLYVEDGVTLRPLNTTRASASRGNFAMQPNGVFHVDRAGRAAVTTTQQWQQHPPSVLLATQSGPMLVIDGAINPSFDADSDSLKWRSGVCAITPQHVAFAISEAPVSFHAFARIFRDELGCRDALYLDGTLSRLYVKGQGYFGAPEMMVKPYVGMFAVYADGDG
jgi:uncharacterized protein YigE (DUF2233 family)